MDKYIASRPDRHGVSRSAVVVASTLILAWLTLAGAANAVILTQRDWVAAVLAAAYAITAGLAALRIWRVLASGISFFRAWCAVLVLTILWLPSYIGSTWLEVAAFSLLVLPVLALWHRALARRLLPPDGPVSGATS